MVLQVAGDDPAGRAADQARPGDQLPRQRDRVQRRPGNLRVVRQEVHPCVRARGEAQVPGGLGHAHTREGERLRRAPGVREAGQVHGLLGELGNPVGPSVPFDRAGQRHDLAAAQPRVGPSPHPGMPVGVVRAEDGYPELQAALPVQTGRKIGRPGALRHEPGQGFQLCGAPGRMPFRLQEERVTELFIHHGHVHDPSDPAPGPRTPHDRPRPTSDEFGTSHAAYVAAGHRPELGAETP